MNQRFRQFFPYLAIILACLACYGNIFSHDFNLDDAYIVNLLPQAGESVWQVFTKPFGYADYRPISLLSFAIEQKIAGSIDPHFAHTVNLFLYIALCLLIYCTLRLLPLENNTSIALIATLLFAAHPVHSGVVCSIKSRDTILSLVFSMGTLWCMIRAETGKGFSYWLAGFILFLAALYTKLDSIVIVFIAPLTLWYFFQISLKKILLVYLVLLAGIIFLRYQPVNYFILSEETVSHSVSFVENPLSANPGLGNQISQAAQTLFSYLKFMILPGDYYFYHGYNTLPLHSLLTFQSLFFLGTHLLILLSGILLFRRHPLLSYAILFFYFSLSYCSNFITPVAGIIADRYAFYASLGYCLFIAGGIHYLSLKGSSFRIFKQPEPLKRSKQNPGSARTINGAAVIMALLTGAILLFYTTSTHLRNKDWKNIFTLLEADMPYLENSFEANRIAASNYFKLGAESRDRNTRIYCTEKGLTYALTANKIYSGNLFINESIGQAYFNLGNTSAALSTLRNALALSDTLTISPEVLGDIYYLNGHQFDSAAYYYQMAIHNQTPHESVYMKYLRTIFKTGTLAQAHEFADSLIRIKPESYFPYQCKSFVYLQQKDSLTGLRMYVISFEKGYRNRQDALDIQSKLLRMGDTASARAMNAYLTD